MPQTNPQHQDQKTDIFALGLVFYYIIKDYKPFLKLDIFLKKNEIIEKFTFG